MRLSAGLLCCLCPLFLAAAQAPSAMGSLPTAAPEGRVASSPVPFEFSRLAVRYRAPTPAYPPLARIAKLQGTVLLKLTIGIGGGVEEAQALEGPDLLRPAAESFFRSWTFQPVILDGQPARVQCVLRVPFRLTDAPGRESEPPPSKVVVQFTQEALEGATLLDPGLLQSELRILLDRSGLKQVEASEAGPRDTFHLKLEIRTLRAGADLHLCQTLERCSLWGDRDLADNAPGKPQRIEFLGHVIGQKGEGGFPELLRTTVRRTLDELLVPPTPAVRPKEAAKSAPAPTAGVGLPAMDKVVDFEFRLIRVKYQPPAPPYPIHAKEHRIQGTVILDLTVDPTGRPVQADALEGPTPLLLTAIGYALAWRFEPALINGAPQYARFRLTMPFRLR